MRSRDLLRALILSPVLTFIDINGQLFVEYSCLRKRNMENSAAQIAQEHGHHTHHRSGKGHSSRRKRTKKIVQRLAILLFILIVMLAFLYVWLSSGSPESTGHLWRLPVAQVATNILSNPSR